MRIVGWLVTWLLVGAAAWTTVVLLRRRHRPAPGLTIMPSPIQVSVPPELADGQWCYWHGHEPPPHDTYRICGECWHAFTLVELLESWNRMMDELDPDDPPHHETDPDRVWSCPLCAHDF